MFKGWHVERNIHDFRPDLVVEDWNPHCPILAPLFWKGPHIAVVQMLFGMHHKGFRGMVYRNLDRLALHLYKHVITVNRAYADFIRPFVPDTTVVYNGIDSSLLKTKPVDGGFILFLGRLDIYQKGLDLLISAYKEVASRLPPLVIAGDGKDRKLVELMAQGCPKIRLMGKVEGEQKALLLSRCSFLVAPSRFESWLIVGMEAMACGKMVIAPLLDGLNECLGNWGLRYMFDRELGFLITHANDLRIRGTLNCDRRFMRLMACQFTWEAMARKQFEVYRRVLDECR